MGSLVRYGSVVQVNGNDLEIVNDTCSKSLMLLSLSSITLAVAFEIKQVFDGQQTTASFARKERHESVTGSVWQRRFLVLHPTFLQGIVVSYLRCTQATVVLALVSYSTAALDRRYGRFGR